MLHPRSVVLRACNQYYYQYHPPTPRRLEGQLRTGLAGRQGENRSSLHKHPPSIPPSIPPTIQPPTNQLGSRAGAVLAPTTTTGGPATPTQACHVQDPSHRRPESNGRRRPGGPLPLPLPLPRAARSCACCRPCRRHRTPAATATAAAALKYGNAAPALADALGAEGSPHLVVHPHATHWPLTQATQKQWTAPALHPPPLPRRQQPQPLASPLLTLLRRCRCRVWERSRSPCQHARC